MIYIVTMLVFLGEYAIRALLGIPDFVTAFVHSFKEPYESNNADYIKRNICEKIDCCSVTLVYLTDKTASRKWVNWEIEECLKRGKGVIGVYKGDTPPAKTPPAFHQNGCNAIKWEHVVLIKEIDDASTRRYAK